MYEAPLSFFEGDYFMTDKQKIAMTAVITAVCTAVISIGATSFVKDNIAIYLPTKDADKAFYNKIKAVDTMLAEKYLYDYDKTALEDKAVAAYVDGLDEPYTEYYTANEFSSYLGNIQDGYVGIGVIVAVNDKNQIEVISPFEDSPAYKAGIQPSDIIIGVDGKEYNGDTMNEAVEAIKSGKEGTTVDLTLLRGEEKLNVTVERGDISADSVKGEMLEDGIGYVRITGFNMESSNGEHSTSSEFIEKIDSLTSDGMKKMIIDLRDNPGGVLTEVCKIADRLLPEGIITYTEDKKGEREYFNSDEEELDIPIVILINGNSASASEVLTGALKDYGRATVVGMTSYGKGIVQDVYPFFDGSGISLTSAKYYTPNGVCIHETGITPDVEIDLDEQYKNEYISTLEREQDAQLKKAIEILKEK